MPICKYRNAYFTNISNLVLIILIKKKIIQQALVGEDSGEEQLFSRRLTTCTDLDSSLQKLEVIQLRFKKEQQIVCDIFILQ
jgi:hypothetical protein